MAEDKEPIEAKPEFILNPSEHAQVRVIDIASNQVVQERLNFRADPRKRQYMPDLPPLPIDLQNIRYVLAICDGDTILSIFLPYDESSLFAIPLVHLGIPENIFIDVFLQIEKEILKLDTKENAITHISEFASEEALRRGLDAEALLHKTGNFGYDKLLSRFNEAFGSEMWLDQSITERIRSERSKLITFCSENDILVPATKENLDMAKKTANKILNQERSGE